MNPKSMSASSSHVFELCPARYGAEAGRTPDSNNPAAALGSAVHNTLERWCIDGHMVAPGMSVDALLDYFYEEYARLFGSDMSRHEDGVNLCKTWFDREQPIGHEIISAEVKESFPVTVTHNGEKVTVPFNYIWDRCDRLPDGDIDVVDYKTIAQYINPEDMKQKMQVRCYGLAARIKFPDANRVWITYDMLRHGDPVSVSFSDEENAETYRHLQRLLLRILEADANNLPEQINDECRWCIRKHVCKSLSRHAAVGGVHAMTDPAEAARQRMKLKNAEGALKVAIEELDGYLMKHLESEGVLEQEFDGVKLAATASSRRYVDATQVKRNVPGEVWEEYGDRKISMAAFDKLLKDPRLSPEQRAAVKGLVSKQFSSPSIRTTPLAVDEDE